MLTDDYIKFRRRLITHFTAESKILSDFRNTQFTDEEMADLIATMATHPHTVKYGALLLDAENMKRVKLLLEKSK